MVDLLCPSKILRMNVSSDPRIDSETISVIP